MGIRSLDIAIIALLCLFAILMIWSHWRTKGK